MRTQGTVRRVSLALLVLVGAAHPAWAAAFRPHLHGCVSRQLPRGSVAGVPLPSGPMRSIPHLSTVPYANNDGFAAGIEPVTKHVSACAESRVHLPTSRALVHRSADLRKLGKLPGGGLDADGGVTCGSRILIGEEFVEALDVVERLRKPDYRRHDARWPLASSSSQLMTCSLGIASAVA